MHLVNDGNLPIEVKRWQCPVCSRDYCFAEEARTCCPRLMTPGEKAASEIHSHVNVGLLFGDTIIRVIDTRRTTDLDDVTFWQNMVVTKMSHDISFVYALVALFAWLDMSR